MAVLVLSPTLREQIRQQAEAAYPEETCGILIGRELPTGSPASGDKPRGVNDDYQQVVDDIMPADNVCTAEERRHRYTIAPRALLTAERTAAARGCTVLGFYHSHPDHAARPSATDLATAWPVYAYVIVEVAKGQARAVTCWRLLEATGQFVEEDMGQRVA